MRKIEEERAFFNERAATWDEKVVHDPDKIKTILDLIGLNKGDSVLDVGCGTGVLTPFLLEKVGSGGHILAMDLAEEMVAVAKKKHPDSNVDFQRGNVLEDLGDALFHHIICYSMFPHFEDKKHSIHQLKKHLLPGGTLTIAHSSSRDEINGMHKEQSGTAVEEDRLPDATTLMAYGKEAGLETAHVLDTSEMFLVIFKN